MTEWHHPDRLDRISASGDSTIAGAPASRDEVAEVLKKVLANGKLTRLPRKPRHRQVVLAVLCVNMQRRHRYTEPEINQYLQAALAALNALVDHVTCRRYLVELGFLKRDRAGTVYLLNYPKVEATLSADAVRSVEALVRDAVRRPEVTQRGG